jgi:hypothetical protein
VSTEYQLLLASRGLVAVLFGALTGPFSFSIGKRSHVFAADRKLLVSPNVKIVDLSVKVLANLCVCGTSIRTVLDWTRSNTD